jgi:predicted MFS family arabinose efflux permease
VSTYIRTIPTPSRGFVVGSTLPSYRFLIAGLIALLAFLAFSGGLSFFATGPLTPLIIDHYGVSHTSAGLLTGLGALLTVVLALPITKRNPVQIWL